jgi:hypothetical protein
LAVSPAGDSASYAPGFVSRIDETTRRTDMKTYTVLYAAAEAMFEALEAQGMAEFDPDAARRKGYFDRARELRTAALRKARGQQ